MNITAQVSSYHPNDIRKVFVTLAQKFSISLCLLRIDGPGLHLRTPDTDHGYVDTVLFGSANDIVHMVPISVDALPINIFEIITVGHRVLSVNIDGRNGIHGLHLYHIEAGLVAISQIECDLVTVKP